MSDQPRSSPPGALLWLLLFAAVIGHLPAIGFDFAQDDFASLARAAGLVSTDAWTARPWTTQISWSLLWPVLGNEPVGYHAFSLLLLGGVAIVAARLAARFGATNAGAAAAGLLVLLGPTTTLPIAWVSASNELWAVLFALAALDLWTLRGTGVRPPLAAVLAILSVLSKEPALGLFALLPLATRWYGTEEPEAVGRARRVLVGVIGAAAVAAALAVRAQFAHGPDDPYALGSAGDAIANLGRMTAWAAWPWTSHLPPRAGATALGWALLIGWSMLAWRRARRNEPALLFLLLLAVVSLVPTIPLRDHTYTYYALLANVAVACAVGVVAGPVLTRRLGNRPIAGPGVVLATAITVGLGWVATSARVEARGPDGLLVDPILRRSSIVADVRARLDALLAAPRPPRAIGVLQATRVNVPDEILEATDEPVFVGSPVHLALRGSLGLAILTGNAADARWIHDLDDVPRSGFVFLDAGDTMLRPLGPPTNARLYVAVIAVAAGQFERAHHELWNVIGEQGTEVRFAFDPGAIPLRPEELDQEAPGFVRWLGARADTDPTTGRILLLFEQMYEHVRGKELVRDLEEPLRAPRFDR